MGGDEGIEMRKPDQTVKGHVGLFEQIDYWAIEQVRAYEGDT
ncbi:hypothetical protein MHB46_22495 [Paenibacillus sp. FSL H7-0703]